MFSARMSSGDRLATPPRCCTTNALNNHFEAESNVMPVVSIGLGAVVGSVRPVTPVLADFPVAGDGAAGWSLTRPLSAARALGLWAAPQALELLAPELLDLPERTPAPPPTGAASTRSRRRGARSVSRAGI
jgi:hypothetical protein